MTMERLKTIFFVLNNAIEFIQKKGLTEEFIEFLPEHLKEKVRKVMVK
jgi:hypothetical protein